MGAMGRQQMQPDAAARPAQPVPDRPRTVARRPVGEDMDAPLAGKATLDRGEQRERALRVDALDQQHLRRPSLQVDRAVDVQMLAPGRLLDCHRRTARRGAPQPTGLAPYTGCTASMNITVSSGDRWFSRAL